MTIEMTCETYASFEDDWSPEAYLADYYLEVQPDEHATMRFLSEASALVGDVPVLLEFGCGPTVHHLLPFAVRADEIHVADFLERNLDAVRRWVDGSPEAGTGRRSPSSRSSSSSGARPRRGSCVSVRRSLASDSPPSISPTRAVASRSASPAAIRLCCAASAPTRSPTISTSGAAAPRTSPRSSRPAVGSC